LIPPRELSLSVCSSAPRETRLVAVGVNYGTGDVGTGIGIGLRDPYAKLFPPAAM